MDNRRLETGEHFIIRFAAETDVPVILRFIKELADYEKRLDEVVATEEALYDCIFEKKRAEVLIAEVDGEPIGFALFFHNFSTFLGRAGIYLEDLYIKPSMRNRGFGKLMFRRLAGLAAERNCGRLEWWCLDWNHPSIAFYMSLGAEPMNDWTVYRISGEALDSLAGGGLGEIH